MTKKSSRRRRGGKSKRPQHSNFVSDAGPGCFVARRDVENEWLLEWEDKVDVSEFQCSADEIPDVALDPDNQSVTFCNASTQEKVAYITIYNATVRGKTGQVLENGSTTDSEGRIRACLTFILLCPPQTFAHLCYIDVSEEENIMNVEIDSDVQEWNPHPSPQDEHPLQIGFPLQGGPFLCTQSEGGFLTHFFSGNLHAIDFRCDIGTPLLAVADGTVISVRDDTTVTGIAVSNLFQWNSIQIQVQGNQDPLFVEYVHIATSLVKAGDVVTKGQVIGTSGSIGFSPEPHLHFSAYKSQEATAPTVRVRFESPADSKGFLPMAGRWYTSEGGVVAPTENA